MSKVRHLLTAGSLVKFRGGRFGISESSPVFGRFIFILPDVGISGTRIPTNQWDPDTLKYLDEPNPDFDIICFWKLKSLDVLDRIITNVDLMHSYSQTTIPDWVEPVVYDEEEEEKEEEEEEEADMVGGSGSSEIVVRTSLIVKINDKEVDLKNLSNDERTILKSFGII